MNDVSGYAVFFFPQALEALGDAIKPYLQEGTAGPHVVCNEIDTSGSLIEMTMRGTTGEGKAVVLELMVPVSMVRMIVSSQSDGSFGFGPRLAAPATAALPPVGPTAEPATAQPAALPEGGANVPSAQPAPPTGPGASNGDEAAKPAP
jgi:hypothetical protein